MTKYPHQIRHLEAILTKKPIPEARWVTLSHKPKILLLSSRMARNWYSLGLCHQAIEKAWLGLGLSGHEVTCLNGEAHNSGHLFKMMMLSDILVVLQPLPQFLTALELARKEGWKGKCIFYSFADASMFGFPFSGQVFTKLLRKNDELMVLSEADRRIMKSLISDIKVNVVDIFPWEERPQTPRTVKNLGFYGRISFHKNVHHLILLLWFLKEKQSRITLHLFGEVDGLSNYVMGVKNLDYEKFLRQLIKDLKLEKNVVWHGSVDSKELSQKHSDLLFISPSTHRDENFGWAPREVLNERMPIMLTEWGGYRDLIKKFPSLVTSIELFHSKENVYLNFRDLLSKTERLLGKRISGKMITPGPHFKNSFLKNSGSFSEISPSTLTTQKLIPLWEKFRHENLIIKNLHLHHPDLTQEVFLKHYMKMKKPHKRETLYPWVKVEKNHFKFSFNEEMLKRNGRPNKMVKDIHGKEIPVSSEELTLLLSRDCLF